MHGQGPFLWFRDSASDGGFRSPPKAGFCVSVFTCLWRDGRLLLGKYAEHEAWMKLAALDLERVRRYGTGWTCRARSSSSARTRAAALVPRAGVPRPHRAGTGAVRTRTPRRRRGLPGRASSALPTLSAGVLSPRQPPGPHPGAIPSRAPGCWGSRGLGPPRASGLSVARRSASLVCLYSQRRSFTSLSPRPSW